MVLVVSLMVMTAAIVFVAGGHVSVTFIVERGESQTTLQPQKVQRHSKKRQT